MKRIYTAGLLFVSVVLLGVLSVSCSIDDVQPHHVLDEDNVIQNEESAQKVLLSVYVMWKQSELNSIPVKLAGMGIEGVIQNDTEGINDNELRPENSSLKTVYNTLYELINRANFLITELEDKPFDNIDEGAKERIISEAKFNRALAYFSLLRYFGQFYDLNSDYGVVIRTKPADGIDADKRSSVQEVYDLIESDLTYAMENGPVGVAHYFAGALASKALLAKVMLYTGEYEESAELAKEVMENNGGIALEANYGDIFDRTFNSKEVLFALYHDEKEGGTEMYKVSSTDPSDQLTELADSEVPGEGTLEGMGSNYDPRYLYAYSEATKGVNDNAKYPYEIFDQGNTLYYMRLSEVYLIYAEALTRTKTGDNEDYSEAIEALNAIRNRVGLPAKTFSTRARLLEDIREEKLLELFFENGEPWFDLIRYHTLGDVDAFSIKPSLNSVDQFIMPIPLDALTGNKNLEQNPGY